jgi:hypothetical protein
MKLSQLIFIVSANATTCLMLGCASDATPTASGGAAPVKPAALAPSSLAPSPFTLSTRTADHLAGSLGAGPQPVTFDVRVGANDAVRAEFKDTLGNVVVAVVHADGARHVRYNGHRISVQSDGSVGADAFATLPQAMRKALGVVPLDLACEVPDADGRLMEASALPFNLLQRAPVQLRAPRDLLLETKCVEPGATVATSPVTHDVLVRSKLVVAPRRGT